MTGVDTGYYVDLRNAIIRQAVVDYRMAHKTKGHFDGLKQLTQTQKQILNGAKQTIAEIEAFFKSEWAEFLCDGVDPLYILRKIREETT